MKGIILVISLVALSVPAVAKSVKARGGQSKKVVLSSNARTKLATKSVNEKLSDAGVQGWKIEGVQLKPADAAEFTNDMKSLDKALKASPDKASRVGSLALTASEALTVVPVWQASKLPQAKIIAGVAVNGADMVKSSLDPAVRVEVQEGIYGRIAKAGFDGKITKAEVKEIVDYANKKDVRLDEAQKCK